MESTYYNLLAPASYGGLSKFKPKGYTKKQVREWLQSQNTHTLHKPTKRRFPRRRVVVYGIDHQWKADLVDLAKLTSYNKGCDCHGSGSVIVVDVQISSERLVVSLETFVCRQVFSF
jgi:hypothetical protein